LSATDYFRIGKILGAHGLHGRLKVLIVTDIDSRFDPGSTVYVGTKGGFVKRTIVECAGHKGRIALVKMEGLSDRAGADAMRGNEIFIDRNTAEETRASLDEDSFYYYELLECAVYLDGREFGRVADIVEAGSGNILVIRDPAGKEYMVPFVESMVDTKALAQNRIDIFPVVGLLD